MEEAFPRAQFKTVDEQSFSMDLLVPEAEKAWFNTLLGYADRVDILEPESLQQRIVSHAKAILEKYN
jgi:predicted DNA-binding transcriptional regulator YafY